MQNCACKTSVIIYKTPLFAYFKQKPDTIDYYCTRFLIGSAQKPAKPKPLNRATYMAVKPRQYMFPAPVAQIDKTDCNLSNASLDKEIAASGTFSVDGSTLRLSTQRYERLYDRLFKRQLISRLKRYGFPHEPGFQFQNVCIIFEPLCEDFLAMKQRYGAKMIQSVVCQFKAAKRCKTSSSDTYLVRDFTLQNNHAGDRSILRAVPVVEQIVKQRDFEVYKRQLINSGNQEILDAMRRRRAQRREQRERAEQLRQLELLGQNKRVSVKQRSRGSLNAAAAPAGSQ